MRALAAAAVLLALGGCAGTACGPGGAPAMRAELYFGRNIDGAPGVSEADFARFVDEELTPRFPDGLSVLDAAGQWRGGGGAVEREASKLVIIISPRADREAVRRLDAVRQAYRVRFRQEAVLMVRQPACAAF